MAPDSILEHANLKYFLGEHAPISPYHSMLCTLILSSLLPLTSHLLSRPCPGQKKLLPAPASGSTLQNILSTQLFSQKLPGSLLPLFLRGGAGNKANSTGVENLITTLVLKEGHDSGGSMQQSNKF